MLRYQHLNVEDGLSQSSVYSIYQDGFGFIWLATGDGLNRYDGKQFTSYKSKFGSTTAGVLKNRNINSLIFEDSNHNIWFAADEGVYCMNRRTGEFHVPLNRHEVGTPHVAGVDKNIVWVVVAAKGVYSIDGNTMRTRLYPFTDSIQSKRSKVTLVKGVANVANGVWIVDERGVLFFDKKTLREHRVLLQEGLNDACSLEGGLLLIAAKDGCWLYDIAKNKKEFLPMNGSGGRATQWSSIAEDTVSGIVYVAEKFGGVISKIDISSRSYELLSFQGTDINRLFIDQSQNLWIGTDGAGIYKLDIKPPKFFCYTPRATEDDGFMVKSIYRDDSGLIWMGVFDKGLIKYNPATRKEYFLPLATRFDGVHTGNITRSIAGDVIVTMNSKMLWLDAVTGQKKKELTLKHYPELSSLTPVIYSVSEWQRGHYLVGADMGLYSVHHTGAELEGHIYKGLSQDTFINGWVYNIHNAGNGHLYIGKRNGFAKIRIINDSTPELLVSGLYGLPVRHFYKSKETPILWVATEQGLIAFNETNGKFTVFDELTGIANSYVYAILPENDSTLWVSTNNGISRVAIHYGDSAQVSATFNNYALRDGLQSNEFNTGAYYKCSDGTLMFGGIAGINWFRPSDIKPNPYRARPAIAGIYVDDTLIADDTAMYIKELSLPYNRNTISFTIRALEYTRPDQNAFAYMLEGMDKDWVYTTNDKVRYSNLAPGKYFFRLKVRNNEALWNDEALELVVIINPPYWQTWWFRGLILLLLATAVYTAARLYVRQKVKVKTRELEKQHALNMERLRISKDVHDDIGSGLSRISLLSEMANRKIRDNLPPGKDVGSIATISKELVDNMRDLIWVLNPENTTLDNLVSRIREYCADYLDGIDIDPVFVFPDEVPSLNIAREVQRNVFSTVKEAVNNCVKYSRASEITITLSVVNDTLSIVIVDNGVGFAANEVSPGGNGLRNMKQRITSIGGSFVIESKLNVGTSISLSVPFSRLNFF